MIREFKPRRLIGLLGCALVLATALGSVACNRAQDSRGTDQAPNVIVLLVDTLRADRMSLYGYSRDTTPSLAELAQESLVFERAFSQAGCTFPSVNSILTSQYPQRYLEKSGRGMGFHETDSTLAAILSDNGYETLAVSASRIVRKNPSKYNPSGGFDVGFDQFDESCMKRPAPCVNRAALGWLDGRSAATGDSASAADEPPAKPFLLYLHYMEPHAPYHPPRAFERRYATGQMPNKKIRRGLIDPVKQSIYGDSERPVQAEEVEFLKDLYDEEIRFIDHNLGLLIEELKQRGLYQNTMIVLASDHGEEFFEHGHIAHCRDLAFDTLVETPLLMRLPQSSSSGRKTQLAQNLDIVPTVLDYLRIPIDSYDFEGTSLRPLIERDQAVQPYAYSAQGTSRAIANGRYQLLLDLESSDARLFDLNTPPAEQIDLGNQLPEVRDELLAALAQWVETVEGSEAAQAISSARELEERLKAVGYL